MNSNSGRTREKMDLGWLFHKGELNLQAESVWHTAKGGTRGGLTDCGVYEDIKNEDGTEIRVFVEKPIETILNPAQWVEVNLPHDWAIEGQFLSDRELVPYGYANGYLRTGFGYYRKQFNISASDEGKKITLEFDGVFRNSTVWVNGHLLGTYASGYMGFHYDLTDIVRYGDEGKNVVFVQVDAREQEGWWYEGAGIYRHVWLEKTDRLHVAHWGTYITTPAITERSAEVNIRTSVVNEFDAAKKCELVSTVVNAEGNIVASISSRQTIGALKEVIFEQKATVNSPIPWSPETPYLYKVLTEVKADSSVVDTYETTFGIRTIEFTDDKGFFLNGKLTPIKGVCCHQDFAGVGVALSDRLSEYRIELLKEMGANAYRTSHNPPAPELLDACDALGMMVMCENRKFGISPNELADLKSMIYRDRNHPSIIIWSVENEEHLAGTKMGTRMLKTLVNTVHEIDPTRPVTAALCRGYNNAGYSDVLDVVGYNYGQRQGGLDVQDHQKHPHRKIVGSETTAFVSTRGIYNLDAVSGYYPEYGGIYGHCCLPEEAWLEVVKYPYLSGIFVWTGFDYRGESVPFGWPSVMTTIGIMDLCGLPKDQYYYYKSAWTDEPIVHIFPHWNWPGREGKEIEVWAFSNCDSVELFLNNKSLGEQKMIPNSHITWKVKYSPGELTAKARKNGKIVAEKTVATTNSPLKILLNPDRSAIKANGCDVSVVRVAILDDQNRVAPTADNDIVFTLEGNGKILGVGNGDPSSHEADKPHPIIAGFGFSPTLINQVAQSSMPDGYEIGKQARRRAFNGYCIVLVQAGKEPGAITLKATSQALLSGSVTITVGSGINEGCL